MVQNVNTSVADTVLMTLHVTDQMAFVIWGVKLDIKDKNVTQVLFFYYTSFITVFIKRLVHESDEVKP